MSPWQPESLHQCTARLGDWKPLHGRPRSMCRGRRRKPPICQARAVSATATRAVSATATRLPTNARHVLGLGPSRGPRRGRVTTSGLAVEETPSRRCRPGNTSQAAVLRCVGSPSVGGKVYGWCVPTGRAREVCTGKAPSLRSHVTARGPPCAGRHDRARRYSLGGVAVLTSWGVQRAGGAVESHPCVCRWS